MKDTLNDVCAIDFGTSNSALAYFGADPLHRLTLAHLEPGFDSMPTAVFYAADDGSRRFGRDAIAAYVDGLDGRLMRSIKSILGSDLMQETTEIAPGRSVRYLDVVVGYLRHLRDLAENQRGGRIERVLLGRPVHFVDDDPKRDAQAQRTLEQAARAAGFAQVRFEYEPIAAALDFESRLAGEQLVLVADIGGGTSDFSVVRVGPARRAQAERGDDILANHGVHIAGTDFDRALNLALIMPTLGYRSASPGGRDVPTSIYFELATWHLINTTYSQRRIAELRQMRRMYADTHLHARLLRVLQRRLGHALAARAEGAKIEVALGARATIRLDEIEAGLDVLHDEARQRAVLVEGVERIAEAASETARLAGVAAAQIDALYFTGGSTGLAMLTERIGARFEHARHAAGDRFISVVGGLAIAAGRRFGHARAA